MDNLAEKPTSEIADFYANRCVLVTGATGFLGKALIEKLLRSVPRLRKIYVLVRPRKGHTASERWLSIWDTDLFDTVRKMDCADPNYSKTLFDKVVPVHSELAQPELELSAEDAERICEDVSVVFHCAATIKFDEPMRSAMRMNVIGTQRLLRLCEKMKRLDAFVHASTAFCNCNRNYTMERVYPAIVDPQKLVDAVEWMTDDMWEALTQCLIGPRPNTYTFTKALSESLLVDESKRMPITIVRPSIVTAAWREPMPGWVDNYNGATGLLALAMKGIIRTLYGRVHENKADIIPVDIAVNVMIVAGWHRGAGKMGGMPVIHTTTGVLNPITWGYMVAETDSNMNHMPLKDLYREPGGNMTVWRFEYRMRLFLDHVLPAYVLDALAYVVGKKRMLVMLYRNIFKVLDTLEYFYTNRWEFQSKMVQILNEQMSDEDRRRFCIDVRRIDWMSYMYDYNVGIRKYILKEDLSTVPEGQKVRFRRRALYNVLNMGLCAFILRLFVRKTTIGATVWSWLMTIFKMFHRKSVTAS